MKFQCIECKTVWGVGNKKGEGYSHGLCKECARLLLTDTIRRKQLREGHFDCFAKAKGGCSEIDCKYRKICF